MNTLCVFAQYGVIYTCSLTEFFNEHFHDIFNNGFLNGNAHGLSRNDFTSPFTFSYFLVYSPFGSFSFLEVRANFSSHVARSYIFSYLSVFSMNILLAETFNFCIAGSFHIFSLVTHKQALSWICVVLSSRFLAAGNANYSRRVV